VAVRPIVRYPDPSLKQRSPEAAQIDQEGLAEDLIETMRASPATVGLAAPQIGIAARAFVLDVSAHPRASSAQGLVVVFDPVIQRFEGSEVLREGCLSVPDLTANVRRATLIDLRGLGPDRSPVAYRMEGFEARAALHEIDHLDGVLILDRVASGGDLFPRKVYRDRPG
jgi:peptide deformylase